MYMHIENSPIPEGMVESFEDAWEEIEDYPALTEVDKPINFAFIGLEDEKTHHTILISHINKDKWVMVVGDTEKEMDIDELKRTVKEFFDGKMPDWSNPDEWDMTTMYGELPDFIEREG
ncbi:MAG: hypothetical protein ACTSU2_13315 [Promethearchaeota archaeon]